MYWNISYSHFWEIIYTYYYTALIVTNISESEMNV